MRRSFFLAALFVLFSAGAACAHAPEKIDLVYDPSGKVLAAKITHPVADPAAHYIGKVDISLNGEEIITQEISRQDNGNTLTVTYLIPEAKSGDRIGVEAYCNYTGELEKEIEVK